MKKFMVILAVIFAAPAWAGEKNATINVDVIVAKMAKSVLHIVCTNKEGDTISGSCGVISTSPKATIVVTAGHVTDDVTEASITYGGKKYKMLANHAIDDCDAAWCEFEPIIGVEPLGLNLDSSPAPITSISLGYWGRAGFDGTLTGAFGKINRRAIDQFSGENFKIWKALLPGTQIVYYGYSGGVVIDEFYRLVAINSMLTPLESLSVDIRFVWNHLPWNKCPVQIPYDTNYNLIGTSHNGLKRLPVSETDKVTLTKDDKTTITSIAELRLLLKEETNNDENIIPKTELIDLIMNGVYTIGGKNYTLTGGRIGIRGKIAGSGPSKPNSPYIMVMGEGYSLTLVLKE